MIARIFRLVAQTAAQPGIMTVWLDILALGTTNSQLRCLPVPGALVGKTFAELRRSHPHAVVCGVVSALGDVKFNPGDDRVAEAGSQMIVLVRSGA